MIEDFKYEGIKIVQKRQILFFLIFCVLIYKLIKRLLYYINLFKNKIKTSLKEHYFINIIIREWNIYIIDSLKIILIVILIIFIWRINSFSLYIDPNKIPTDSTSLNEIISVFIYKIKEDLIGKDNLYIFTSYRKAKLLLSLSKYFLAIGFISIVLLFNYVKRVLNIKN